MDGSDLWYHHAYDERWRWVGTFRDADSDPKEEFLHHGAGLDGFGGASYIDLVAYRDRDANTAWTSASDGTLEERIYYGQNWRADVSVLVTQSGTMLEWTKYSAYGVPFGLPGGDTDSDGDCDSTDVSQVQTWIDAPAYDVRGDIDLDGDVDSVDKSTVVGTFEGSTLGRFSVSDQGNRVGYSGRGVSVLIRAQWHHRNRDMDSSVAIWLTRDPLGYVDGPSLLRVLKSSPVSVLDPSGTNGVGVGGLGTDGEPRYKIQPGCAGECAWICAEWQANNSGTDGFLGQTICGSTGNKCACIATPEQIEKLLKGGYKPRSQELKDVQDAGTPMPPEFVEQAIDCIQAHEEYHVNNSPNAICTAAGEPPEPPRNDPNAPINGEIGATAAGLDCISGIDCGGDPDCEAWKEGWFTHNQCKMQWLTNALNPGPNTYTSNCLTPP